MRVKREYLRSDLDPEIVELFPPDRPADRSAGLGAIIDPAANEDITLRFEDLGRLRLLPPPRTVPDWYGGLRLIAKVDDPGRFGHHAYDRRAKSRRGNFLKKSTESQHGTHTTVFYRT